MSNIWREQLILNKDFSKETKWIMNIKTRLKDISSQEIINTFETNHGKLTFLAQTKKSHKFESYLNINNFEHRRAIAKLEQASIDWKSKLEKLEKLETGETYQETKDIAKTV